MSSSKPYKPRKIKVQVFYCSSVRKQYNLSEEEASFEKRSDALELDANHRRGVKVIEGLEVELF